MCFDIIIRYKPQQIWFMCYPNTKPVPYQAPIWLLHQNTVSPKDVTFSDSRRRHMGVLHTRISLRPGFEYSCNKDLNGLESLQDVNVCRWVSVSRRREWTGCLHVLSSCGQRTISYINLFTSFPHQVRLFPKHRPTLQCSYSNFRLPHRSMHTPNQ
jgi:hypothetical protein